MIATPNGFSTIAYFIGDLITCSKNDDDLNAYLELFRRVLRGWQQEYTIAEFKMIFAKGEALYLLERQTLNQIGERAVEKAGG